jgi:hypothetical protein
VLFVGKTNGKSILLPALSIRALCV